MATAAERAVSLLQSAIGASGPPGDWHTVTQEQIDSFARTTLDDQFIHTDAARAAKESPFGTTIAHGFLTLSLISYLVRSIPPAGRSRPGTPHCDQLRIGKGPLSQSGAGEFPHPGTADARGGRTERPAHAAGHSPHDGRDRRRVKTRVRRRLDHPRDLRVSTSLFGGFHVSQSISAAGRGVLFSGRLVGPCARLARQLGRAADKLGPGGLDGNPRRVEGSQCCHERFGHQTGSKVGRETADHLLRRIPMTARSRLAARPLCGRRPDIM